MTTHERQRSGPVPDVVAPGLRVLFCGINPGLRSAELAQHFARPGNRFWKVLHGAGFTDRVLTPAEQLKLLEVGIGITNLVADASASANELTLAQLRAGARELERKVAVLAPRHVAVVGAGAYRKAFARPKAVLGEQPESLAGARLWLLPNPSGLQARYQLADMIHLYHPLAVAAGLTPGPTWAA